MDFRQLTYICAIAEEENISRAAEKMYITRSALNYCLLNIEKKLGFQLFYRISNRMIPTHAGKIFLENARKVMISCKEMDHSLQALSDTTRQPLSIGLTVGGGQAVFTQMFPEYHQQYPFITLNLMEGNIRVLEQALLNGSINLAFFGEIPENSLLDCREVTEPQSLRLAVPKDHSLVDRYGLKDGEPTDLKLFESEAFITMNRKSFLSERIDSIFRAAKIRPHIMMECSQINMVIRLIEGKAGLGFVPENLLKAHPSLMGFPVQPEIKIHQTFLFRKQTIFSQPELDFMEGIVRHYTARNRQPG